MAKRSVRRARWIGYGLALIGGAALLVSCHGEPDNTLLTVTTTVDGSDATVGDGICEMTAGAGDCSLRAAIDEANAATVLVPIVTVPSGTYTLTVAGNDDTNTGGDLDLDPATGSIVLQTDGNAGGAGVAIDAAGADHVIDVQGGTAVMFGFATRGAASQGIVARSGAAVTVGYGTTHANTGAGLSIEAGGSAHLLNATVSTNAGGGVVNGGTLDIVYTTITRNAGFGIDTVNGLASTTAEASIITEQTSGADCIFPLVSNGWNFYSDGSCGFGTNDGGGVPAFLAPLSSDLVPVHRPLPNSVAIDAIAPGTGKCLTPGSPDEDQVLTPRPLQANCDRGAIEADFSLTVNTPLDGPDLIPGDNICEMTASTGDCSLRAAIDEANDRGGPNQRVITLAADAVLSLAGAGEDENDTGDLDTLTNITIVGNDHSIDADQLDRVVDHRAGTLTIIHTRITGGSLTDGTNGVGVRSAGSATTGPLTLDHDTIEQNRVPLLLGGLGAIALEGGATGNISHTTIRDNRAAGGGAIAVLDSTLHLDWSALIGNVSGHAGAALWLVDSTTTITSSTIAGSTTDELVNGQVTVNTITVSDGTTSVTGSTITQDFVGPMIDKSQSPTPFTVSGTVLVPGAGDSCGDYGGAVTSLGWNVASDHSCLLEQPGDQQGVNPMLAAPADNGGPTPTQLPFGASPVLHAIPAGTAGLCDAPGITDQRGIGRPSGTACDAGAVEGSGPTLTALDLTVDTATDAVDAIPGDGACDTGAGTCSLRAAVTETNLRPTTDTVTIAPGIDPTLSIAGAIEDANLTGDLDLHDFLVLHGNGATVDAAGLDRAIDIDAGRQVIDHLDIVNGVARAGPGISPRGGAIRTTGDLDLEDGTVRSNQASIGGGVDAMHSRTTIVRSSILDNFASDATDGGGGVATEWADITIDSSTLARNRTNGISCGFGCSAPRGGAIYIDSSAARIVNSTIVANQGPSVVQILGSGLTNPKRTAIVATTIADNIGSSIKKQGVIPGYVTVTASVISPLAGEACDASGIPITSGGWNVTYGGSCAFTQPTDREIIDPQLFPLADNGGPTLTRQPATGGPLVDTIPVGTPGLCDAAMPTDQRGVARPAGTACDIGAVEGSATAPAPLALTVDTATDAVDSNPSDGICDIGDGTCSLRAAITETNLIFTPDSITIAPGVDPTIALAGPLDETNATGDFDVHDALAIAGNGATIDAAHLDRAFHQLRGSLALSDMIITGGDTDYGPFERGEGGAIRAFNVLTLDRTTITGNISGAYASEGGAISAPTATVTARDSTITGNIADAAAGILAGTLVLDSTTVTANGSAGNTGNAVQAWSATLDRSSVVGNLTRFGLQATNAAITSSTISGHPVALRGSGTGNTLAITASTLDAGEQALQTGADPIITAASSILSSRTGSACSNPATSLGGNVATDATCGLTAAFDQQSANPLLSAAADNGGPTPTSLPAANSPAIDAIPVGTPGLCDATTPTDQRGVARPAGAGCDSGAVEGFGPALTPLSLTVDTAADALDATPGDGTCATTAAACSLRAAITEANLRPTDDAITITAGVNPTLSRAGVGEDSNVTGDFDVLGTLTIHGNDTILDGALLDRVLDVRAAEMHIDHLTIRRGRLATTNARGAGIAVTGSLDLDHVTVTNNRVTGTGSAGGGVAGGSGPMTITASTITANNAVSSGGGVSTHSTTSIADSTIGTNSAFAGAGIDATGTLAVDRSTISSNGGVLGGAMSFTYAFVTIRNSTVSGNTGLYPGLWMGAQAPGPLLTERLDLIATTIVNTAAGPAIRNDCIGCAPISQVTMTGTIVKGAAGFAACVGPIVSNGYNITSDATCGTALATDQVNTDALLGPLTDNSGPTFTNLPGAASPATDAIPSGTAGLCDGTLTTDQRGNTRPIGVACDIGATEQ